MELVDTHCHIQSAGAKGGERTTQAIWAKQPSLTSKVLVKNAVNANVTRLIVVGCDLPDSRLACEFVSDTPNTWASIGIHPHEAKDYAHDVALKQQFSELVSRPKVVAIGECGLDYYYNHSNKDDQIEVLQFQIELAHKHNLPLIFHVRDAFEDFWPIFDKYPHIRGVLHSFTDNMGNLEKAIERNLMIGVNGIATFAKKPEQLEVYCSVPLENLVLETDAPFLTPIPHRGTINEPKYISEVASYLAHLKGTTLNSIAEYSTRNAIKLFGL